MCSSRCRGSRIISHIYQPVTRLLVQINFGHEKVIVLKNQKGMEAHILTLGAIVQSLRVPDKHGELDDVVLGFDDLEPYKVPLTSLLPITWPLLGIGSVLSLDQIHWEGELELCGKLLEIATAVTVRPFLGFEPLGLLPVPQPVTT